MVTGTDDFASFRGRRVFVTGHTGFKGSWLCLWLARLGAEVAGYSDAIPTDPNHFALLDLGVTDVRGDIADLEALEAAVSDFRPDLIYHFAAQSLVRKAYVAPLATFGTNVMGTLALLEAARKGGTSAVVVATTDKVYRNDESGRPYREDDEVGGLDPYSASKSCAEIAVRSWRDAIHASGEMLVATARAGNVIGGGDWSEDRLLPDLMRAAYSGNPVIVRNPASTRPWQHVLDVLAGYLAIGSSLLTADRASAEAWNIGPTSASITVDDIVAAVRRQVPALQVQIRADESGPHEANLLQLDSSKIIDRLGWRPRWEDEMISRTIDWYQAFYERGELVSGDQIADYEVSLVR